MSDQKLFQYAQSGYDFGTANIELPVPSGIFGNYSWYSENINQIEPFWTNYLNSGTYFYKYVTDFTNIDNISSYFPVNSQYKQFLGTDISSNVIGENHYILEDNGLIEFTPNPFVNHLNPLGDDQIPFTDDDGLKISASSTYGGYAIDTQTVDLNLETTDILEKNRLIGDGVDLGAYEYVPVQDADSDGVSDADDAFPNDPNETLDTDGDDLGDNQDSDDDGDGVDDIVEIAVGTNPKQYNGAFYNFVQSLGSGSYDEDDLNDSRLAGQSDVTSEPQLFNLYTLDQISFAVSAGRTQGQNDVTSDPSSFSLFSTEDYNLAQSSSRTLGQQDVITSPLSYGLYNPSYVISLLDSSRTAGQNDVTGDPSSYGLYSEQGITDLRPGSTILQIGPNNSATLELQIERSNDLNNWTTDTDDLVEVEIPINGDTEFFRFRIPIVMD